MKTVSIIFIFSILLVGCESQAANMNLTSTQPSPSPMPTISKEEAEKESKESREEVQKAINEFIAKNYKGWQFQSWSNVLGQCNEYSNEICDLLLTKGSQEKIVAVKFKRFTTETGKARLIVFEARPIDLSKAKIELIKENYLDNLQVDEVPYDLKNAIIESAND